MGSMCRAGGQLAHLIGQDYGQAVENLLLERAWLDEDEKVRSCRTERRSTDMILISIEPCTGVDERGNCRLQSLAR